MDSQERLVTGLCYPVKMIGLWRRVRVVLAGCALAAPAHAQMTPDPGFLDQYAATYHFRLGRPGGIRPTPDGEAILFQRSGPRSFEQALYELDVSTSRERVLITADELLDGAYQTFTDEEY